METVICLAYVKGDNMNKLFLILSVLLFSTTSFAADINDYGPDTWKFTAAVLQEASGPILEENGVPVTGSIIEQFNKSDKVVLYDKLVKKYEDGILKQQSFYDNDILQLEKIFEDGHVVLKRMYSSDGKLQKEIDDHTTRQYNENGNLEMEKTFVREERGEIIGNGQEVNLYYTIKEYDNSGKLKKEHEEKEELRLIDTSDMFFKHTPI